MADAVAAPATEVAARPADARILVTRIAIAALALSLLLRLATTYTHTYAQDDFFWAYTSWLRSQPLTPNVDYHLTNFTPLSELAAPLFRIFPESLAPFYIARTVMYFVGLLLLWATFLLARQLGASTLWALVAVNAVTWQHHFAKRIGDIRADQLTALFLVLAIVYALRRRALTSGLLFGLAVAISYKLAVAGPFLLIGIVLGHRQRGVSAAASFIAGSAVAPATYFGWRIAADGWETVWVTLQGVLQAVGSGVTERWAAWQTSFAFAPIVMAAMIGGAVAMAMNRQREERAQTQRAFAILTVAFTIAYIAANPFIFPYNFTILMPLLAPLLVGVPLLLRTRTALFASMVAALVTVSAVLGGAFATYGNFTERNDSQHRILDWIWTATAPAERVFDWQGTHLGRRGTFHWWHFRGWGPKYLDGWYSVAAEIRRAQVTLILVNYRLAWLSTSDRKFVERHFVQIDECLLTPGWSFPLMTMQPRMEFDAFLEDGVYRAQPSAGRGILIDGKPLQPLNRLRAGRHTLSFAEGARIPQNLALYYTTPLRDRTTPPCRGEQTVLWHN